MAEKQYVDKGKKVGNYGMINMYLRYADLKPNEKGFVSLTIGELRNVDDKGNTHSVWVNDWMPTARPEIPSRPVTSPAHIDDECPF